MGNTKLPQKKYEAMWDVVDAVPYNNGRMIARALGKRPYKKRDHGGCDGWERAHTVRPYNVMSDI